MKTPTNQYYLFALLLFILPHWMFGQHEEGRWLLGVKGGGQVFYFQKEDLVQTLFKDYASNPNCMHISKYRYGGNIGMYFYFRPTGERFAFENEISYSFKIQGEPTKDYDLLYATVNTTPKSDLYFQMNYEYLNISALGKIYLDYSSGQNVVNSGINLILGGQIAIVTADDRLNLGSTITDATVLLNSRAAYRDTYRGLNNLSLIGGIGWESKDEGPFNIQLRYYLGLKDLVETKNASLGGTESLVRARIAELSIGFTFPR